MKKIIVIFSFLLITAGYVKAGEWTVVGKLMGGSPEVDAWEALVSEGMLIKASNLGSGAQAQTAKGIDFDIDYSNLTGDVNPTSSTCSFYTGTDPAIANLLNTGARSNEYGPYNMYFNFSGLTIGNDYRFQVLIGSGSWDWCGVNLYGIGGTGDYRYAGFKANSLNLATYIWTADAETRQILVQSGSGQGYIFRLAYALHDLKGIVPYDPVVFQESAGTTANVTLGWKAAPDPNEAFAVHPDIADQYVFMSPTPTDPNLFYIGATGEDPGLTDPNSVFYVAGLPYDATYNWAVVEAMDGYEQVFTAGVSKLENVDPNNIIGPTWTFDTLASIPVIVDQPSDILAGIGESASFTISVTSISPESYVWYKSADNANNTPGDDETAGSTSNVLSFPSAAISNEGYYYCLVTNSGGSTLSNVARLGVKRQMAHWTLDQADYSGGQYRDVSTDDAVYYPADANGVPTFDTTGIVGDAVLIDAENGWAQAGTWDPSQFSNQLTVSAWVKWDGDGGTDGIVSKRNTWSSTTMRWSLTMRDGGSVRFYNPSGLDAWPGDTLPVNEWTFVAATFDGTTGKVYLDGVEKAADGGSLSNGVDSMIMIGALENPATGSLGSLNSTLDDVQIYNYALDKYGVADMYKTVTGQSVCINEYASDFDISGLDGIPDCIVNLYDFAEYAANWLSCGLYPNCP